MYIYICLNIYIYIWIYIYIYIEYMNIYIYIHICIYEIIYTCTVHIYIYISTARMYVYVCRLPTRYILYVYIYIWLYMYTHVMCLCIYIHWRATYVGFSVCVHGIYRPFMIIPDPTPGSSPKISWHECNWRVWILSFVCICCSPGFFGQYDPFSSIEVWITCFFWKRMNNIT